VATERGIRIEPDIGPGLAVRGDAHLIRLAAFNLIDNALKHSPANETVRVTLAARDAEVELVVADRGEGVAPGNRDRLFRRYARGVRSGDPGVGGLGLSVVAWVTRRHGGHVRLLDTARGAAFQVVLPGLVPDAPVGPAREALPATAGGPRAPREESRRAAP
jgi:signal transduction histidine kinase